MPPPKLSPDRPIAFLTEPIDVALAVALRIDFDLSIFDRIDRRLGKIGHGHKPLVGQVGFDRCFAPIAVLELDLSVFGLFE